MFCLKFIWSFSSSIGRFSISLINANIGSGLFVNILKEIARSICQRTLQLLLHRSIAPCTADVCNYVLQSNKQKEIQKYSNNTKYSSWLLKRRAFVIDLATRP